LRIPVSDHDFGIEGEIALVNSQALRRSGLALPILSFQETNPFKLENTVLRGGFKIGGLGLLPVTGGRIRLEAGARLRLTWQNRSSRRYLSPNLARNSIADKKEIEEVVTRWWLTYLLRNAGTLPAGQIDRLQNYFPLHDCKWLEEFDALTIYKFG